MQETQTNCNLGDDTLSPFEFAMEEVNFAIVQLVRALASHDAAAIKRESVQATVVYRRLLHLCGKLRLTPTQRDPLLGQLGVLRGKLDACEGTNPALRPDPA